MYKKYLLIGVLGCLSVHGFSQTKAPAKKPVAKPVAKAPALKNRVDSVSYGIGVNIAENLKAQDLEHVNTAVLVKAIQDVLKKQPLVLSKEECDMSISNYLQQLKAEKAAKNKEEGLKFLAANKTKEGVVTLPDGLQYQILQAGNGPKPTINDKVKTHYHGTLIDGTVFDSSVERGQPISFPVSGVIKGWTEALQLMPVGSKWRLFIPSDLAYGDRGAGPKIGPGSTLIFDVELLAIEQ
ncbi:FKBP-type peptidyl-prolyl cis-trans isomerase FklB [Chitinophaga terrae (ex Kim and Jung 2007)]|uniref:Peptidyl-prolyl cis-trans isomerase n=1 Tax=Chitinophaga terrae (ex Kim and Jung 2007) TaxID=408074 RepID=A0A1H4C347_9BACT|nr:FKBP-type peptidyl-prolyl cis-trans isomerase [Chitinophaga terrae (ex Kim and Jung 2007)]MDQ0108517.1 FKBP-type peptidyl-prolyl cis-trans isomerase FklB [Chitinophaga terrae (ex Kim and Jung 2007)]GEP92193.1 peptidyl-prolyl cis-trans isomerase [Chitinophaga terrae (ex Kim and Jung 2007)]SEA54875.1 FKBP-type peptidyl-prolyl cis-trans isomerase FklB [Chitinophaga terrae (ex Kim and Jung 2007)]